MADYQQILIEEVAVASEAVLWSLTTTESAGTYASLVYIAPRRQSETVGVATSLVYTPPRSVTSSMGVESSVVVTLPSDTRVSWIAVTGNVLDYLHEQGPLSRTKKVEKREYGLVTIHGRQFVCNRNNILQAALETVLAPGAHMLERWADEWFSLRIDGPKVVGIEAQPDGKASAVDSVRVAFVAIKTLEPISDGYNATARYPVGGDAFSQMYVEWGISPSIPSNAVESRNLGIPLPGDALRIFTDDTFAPRCVNVQYDDRALPGRWLVKSTYRSRVQAVSKAALSPEMVPTWRYDEDWENSGSVSVSRLTMVRKSGSFTVRKQ